MKNTRLDIGNKARQRGSTFSSPRTEIKRTKSLRESTMEKERQRITDEGMKAAGIPRRKPISPASKAQREKARMEPCIVTGQLAIEGAVIDPMHLCPRSHGGCDDALCVVPGRRDIHRAFDDGELDLLPYLVGRRTEELCHALGHYEGSLLALVRRLTGVRHVPEEGT